MSTPPVTPRPARAAGSLLLGGDLQVSRLGYGTMQLPGPGVWGDAKDPAEAVRVLRRAVELGITFIDTADAYGPFTADHLLRQALHPYPDDLVIATKVGFARTGPGGWTPLGRPEYLRQQTELNLRHLGVECIDLLQLHRIDPKVPFADQVGTLAELQREGKVRHLGLSNATVPHLDEASGIAQIVSVQNRFNLTDRAAEGVLEYAERHGIVFIPWYPLATGALAGTGGPLDTIAAQHRATPSQLALAWLLRRSPALLPIPGTSSVAHLEENTAGATIELTDDEYAALDRTTG